MSPHLVRRQLLAAVLLVMPAFAQKPAMRSALVCARCHTFLAAPPAATNAADGASVAPYWLWLGTMMRHAGVDPYWQAAVRHENSSTPGAERITRETCIRCHQPAGQFEPTLAEEGITCTVCHQIKPDNLGTRESFDAGFRLNGESRIFGPHRDPFPMPMRMMAGYVPEYGPHILESALCGSCHTVITPILDADGNQHGEFLEQAPYLEWRASGFPQRGTSCRDCHMPVLADSSATPVSQYIAHHPNGSGYFPPTSPRSPFGQHVFLGANTVVPQLLARQYSGRAGDLLRTVELNRKFLKSAVDVSIGTARSGSRLFVDVTLRNRTGHKLPTGHPSRRLWIHMKAESMGEILFESGSPLTAFEEQPHHSLIDRPEQAMVYEAQMSGVDNRPVTLLLRAAHYTKDNRLLPEGFQADAELAPRGLRGDTNFVAGSDTVRYSIPAANRPSRITVRVMYQSIKPSHDLLTNHRGSAPEVLAEVVREIGVHD